MAFGDCFPEESSASGLSDASENVRALPAASFCMRAARLWLEPISPLYTAARDPADGASVARLPPNCLSNFLSARSFWRLRRNSCRRERLSGASSSASPRSAERSSGSSRSTKDCLAWAPRQRRGAVPAGSMREPRSAYAVTAARAEEAGKSSTIERGRAGFAREAVRGAVPEMRAASERGREAA